MIVYIAKALKNLCPTAEFSIQNSEITWLSPGITQPTEAEINAEITRLQAEYEANEYQRKREAEYPSFADQFDTLYHGGYDAWKATIDAVKTKYPKGA